ncbi:MAG TPA: SRPBCC domain-containing protein [Candidatus Acidoferrum sp.]|nr:SRPBCC domain-containing protein [Candidatus Acidoferrum sp.]
MASSQPLTDLELKVRRTFAAPRERVFQAWTKPEALTAWFCHGKPAHTGKVDELDLRVGGKLEFQIHDQEKGLSYQFRGKYIEIQPPEKLTFTWSWDGHPEWGETVVSLEFHERGNSTELILRHGAFPTMEARDGHNNGWKNCMESLEKFLAEQPTQGKKP